MTWLDPSLTQWYVDSDNGLGSTRGDVDDGFALASLLGTPSPLAGVGSVFGNAPEGDAARNNEALVGLGPNPPPTFRGARGPGDRDTAAARWLQGSGPPLLALALGPLTNLAAALRGKSHRVGGIVTVGGNFTSRGKIPPLWPYEFNWVKDRAATATVLESTVPLWVVPLDVAKRMVVRWPQVEGLDSPLGRHLAHHSRRWFRRNLWLKGGRVPLWDLVATGLALWPEHFHCRTSSVRWHGWGWGALGRGGRGIQVVTDFDPDGVWKAFIRRLGGPCPADGSPSNHNR